MPQFSVADCLFSPQARGDNMGKHKKKYITIVLLLLLIAAIAIIIIEPTYVPGHLSAPNHNHPLETMAAIDSWAFTGTGDIPGRSNSIFFDPTLARVEIMYDQLDRNTDGTVIYPDFYGGITVNGGQLTLLIVEGRLEEAKAHNAFSHLFARNTTYSFVELSFAQLIETRAKAVAAIAARPGCFYADNALEPEISSAHNRVYIYISLNNADGRDMEAGFLQYVFDSPMIIVRPAFIFPFWERTHPIYYVARLLVFLYALLWIPYLYIMVPRA